MDYTSDELDTIQAMREIKGCEDLSEEECLEVWEFMLELERRLDLD